MTTAVRVDDLPYHTGLIVDDYKIGTVDFVDIDDADVDRVYDAAHEVGLRLASQVVEEDPPEVKEEAAE
jgi:hypothetical protein